MKSNFNRLYMNSHIKINRSPPSAAYMRKWIGSALIQIMAWRRIGVNYYLNQCLIVVNRTLGNKLQWNFNQKPQFSFSNKVSENIVCDITTILSWGDDPADTLRKNDVVIKSKRRHCDVITSQWRRFDVITTSLLRHVFRGELMIIVMSPHYTTRVTDIVEWAY